MTSILLMLTITYNSIALSAIVILLLILIKFYRLGEIRVLKTIFAFIFILVSMILDIANFILNLAIYLDLIGPRFFLPTDLPYSIKYFFLWSPQLILYPLAYILMYFSLREGKTSFGLLNIVYVQIFTIIKFPFMPISYLISLMLVTGILYFYIKVSSNVNKWVLVSLITLIFSYLLQMMSCFYLSVTLYMLSVLIRSTAFIILLIGGIRGEPVEEEI